MDESERAALAARIDQAHGSASELNAIFNELVDRLGRDGASSLWWAAFGAGDATET